MHRNATVTVVLGAALGLLLHSQVDVASAKSMRCSGGTAAVIGGRAVCLKAGTRCSSAQRKEFPQYGYRCVSRRGSGHARLKLGRATSRRFGEAVGGNAQGKLSKQEILKVFSHTIGRLPGVHVRKGEVGALRSASGPLHWIQKIMPTLSKPQQRAVKRYVRELFTSSPQVARSGATTQAQAKLILDDAVSRIATRVGEPLTLPTKVVFSGGKGLKDAFATAEGVYDGPGKTKTCLVTITPLGLALSEPALRSALTHEAFHCFQEMWNPSGYDTDTRWLWEGSATWVAATLDAEKGYIDKDIQDWWTSWLTYPWAPLFARTYGAVGFFSHIEEAGINPWTVIKPMIKAANATSSYEIAADAPIAAAGMLDTWAPGYLRDLSLGPGWEFTGPAIPAASVRPKFPTHTLSNGESVSISSLARSAGGGKVELKTDVVSVSSNQTRTYGRIRDSEGNQYSIGTGSYCARPGGCSCPDGKLGPPQTLRGSAIVAVTGHSNDVEVKLKGESLKSYCKHAPKAGHMTITGALSGTITTAGDCTTKFAGLDSHFFSMWVTDSEPTYFVQFTTSYWNGPGNYEANQRGVTSWPAVMVTDGKGRAWLTQSRPESVEGGSYSAASESGTTVTGEVSAIPYNKEEASTVFVNGTWACKK